MCVSRLVLPAALATVLTWFFCQFGAFKVAKTADRWWLSWTSPTMIPYIKPTLIDLCVNIINTWTRNYNAFDQNQWNLVFLLRGAFLVHMFLFATAFVRPRCIMISMALYWYCDFSGDAVWGTQFFFGSFLPDLSQNPIHTAWMNGTRWPSRVLSPLLMVPSLYFASYPETHADWMPWSTFMGNKSLWIFPKDCDTPRFHMIGLECMVLGIHFSNPVKSAVSNQCFLWLVKNSFAVYLLHCLLLRTLLCWMLLGVSLQADILTEDGQRIPGPPLRITSLTRCIVWTPLWFVDLYYVANLWTKHVDPLCARMTHRLEQYVMEDDGQMEKPNLPP